MPRRRPRPSMRWTCWWRTRGYLRSSSARPSPGGFGRGRTRARDLPSSARTRRSACSKSFATVAGSASVVAREAHAVASTSIAAAIEADGSAANSVPIALRRPTTGGGVDRP